MKALVYLGPGKKFWEEKRKTMKSQIIILNTMLVFVFSFGVIHNCNAQIILDINDLPVASDIQISIKVNGLQAATLSPGNAGINVQWDFSNLNPCCGTPEASYDTVVWGDHASTANAGYFPLSDIVRKENCFTYHSHVTHQDETQCYFSHYVKDTMGLWRYGMEDPVNFLFVSYWNFFPLLSFGDSLKTITKIHVPVSNDNIRVYHILSTSVADAWGVITTPDTTANVIRIYTAEIVYDSLYVNGKLQQNVVYAGNYYYRWYAKNLGFPVLEIAKGMQTQQPPFDQQVRYSSHLNTLLSVPENDVSDKVRIFPNPFSSFINIYFGENNKNSSLSIFDATGKTVMKITSVNSEYKVQASELSPGIYFYEIVNKQKEIFRGKLIKNNY
ncbi:MAG: T9SS C-terminal target domain-containing protein [Porphyromonadaceae bacterium]|nr:MAG: T9SS C-terminal target domain-containing protein [Porphyromonadaceae bacterium]